VAVQGYDPNSPAYYKELARQMRLAKKQTGLSVNIVDLPTKRSPRRPAPGEDQGNPVTAQTRTQRKTLTTKDRQDMLMVRLDPNNKEQVEAFLRERTQREARETQRGRVQ